LLKFNVEGYEKIRLQTMAFISAQTAIKAIGTVPIRRLEAEVKWLWQAEGYVLADDVTAPRDIPPFNRSAMDGYAVRIAELKEIPCTLDVVALRAAGDNREIRMGAGECVKIMTGAAVPEDADAVVMIEHTESKDPEHQVTILRSVKPGENIAHRGEDARSGSVVLAAGQLLNAAALSVIAGVGRSTAKVYPKPRISILSTGDELLEPGTMLTDGQIHNIYNSNATLLTGLLNRSQLGTARYLGISKDDRGELAAAIEKGLTDDVLILTGGVSKGDYDYAHEVLEGCGVQVHFHGVKIKPGRPLFFGSTDQGAFVFGLPGNPVSVLVCYHEFVAPLLRRLAGWRDQIVADEAAARCTQAIRNKSGRRFYCTARLYYDNGELLADPIPGHGSGDYVAAVNANGVIIVPEETTRIKAGEEVQVHVW
jgi:molybdopterin molybdotransferase